MAETIFNHILTEQNDTARFEVDSAGIIDHHQGNQADPRMRKHAQQNGYHITHLSRPVVPADIQHYDYIIGMDEQNITALQQMTDTPQERQKIHRMTDYLQHHTDTYVPDPYYGGSEGFEYVIQLLEDACEGLYRSFSKK